MKIHSGVASVIVTLCLFAAFAYAQQSGSQTDPGMQPGESQSDPGMQSGQSGQQPSSAAMQDQNTVRDVQQALNDQGYKAGPVDGIWGSKSQKALKEFQQEEGMQPTGQIDQEVLTALGVKSEDAGAAAGGQDSSMERQNGADAQQDGMSDQQSGAGGGMSDEQDAAGGQQDSQASEGQPGSSNP